MAERHLQLRASDADRELAAEILRRAAGDGRLTIDELDSRLDLTFTAQTRAELDGLTGDLQRSAGGAPAPGVVVRPGEGGARWLLAILGGTDRSGRWRLSERCNVVNVWGASDLDLSEVELASDHVHLNVVTVMGGADIHVPEGLNVEVSQFAFMGGNSVDIGADHPSAGGPVLHLRLVSIMGGSDVTRGPRRSRRELKRGS